MSVSTESSALAHIGKIPDRIGRYEILIPIASGGMATVYLARMVGAGGFERDVALKLTHGHLKDQPEFATILLHEAKVASRIIHRNVVAVTDVGEDPWGVFLVMDYVEGATLSALMRTVRQHGDGRVPTRIGMRILLDALAGLHATHETCDEDGNPLNLVHRDFSPQNVLVGVDGVAKLADFGIAKAANSNGQTETGVLKGKITYVSPEQAVGVVLDRRSDIWSAGVVAWELLTGQRLHGNVDAVAIVLKITSEVVPRVSEVRADVHPELDQVVADALTKDRAQRCPTAAELARRLTAACTDGIASHDEVAAFVAEHAGKKLSERRAELRQVKSRSSGKLGLGPASSGAEKASVSAAASIAPKTSESDRPTLLQTMTSSAPAAEPASPRRRAAARIAIAVGGLAAAVCIGAVLWGSGARSERPARSPSEPSGAAIDSRSPPSVASSAALATAPSAGVPAAAPAPASVSVHANAPIASLRLDGRVVPVANPITDITFDRTPDERTRAVSVQAVAADGRRVTVGLRPDQRALEVEFARGQAAKSAPGTKFAPSPY